MTPPPLTLFDARYAEPVDTSSQVERMPGVDAPCLCARWDERRPYDPCDWPFCGWKTPAPKEEE